MRRELEGICGQRRGTVLAATNTRGEALVGSRRAEGVCEGLWRRIRIYQRSPQETVGILAESTESQHGGDRKRTERGVQDITGGGQEQRRKVKHIEIKKKRRSMVESNYRCTGKWKSRQKNVVTCWIQGRFENKIWGDTKGWRQRGGGCGRGGREGCWPRPAPSPLPKPAQDGSFGQWARNPGPFPSKWSKLGFREWLRVMPGATMGIGQDPVKTPRK
jgi:hypothetical protein